MTEYETLVAEEITTTLDRAGFEHLSSDLFRIDVTSTFQRKLGECQIVQTSDSKGRQYRIRIARRLFENDIDTDWRDTVRHEVAHAYVHSQYGPNVQPHGPEWKEAATRAGADPTARYEGDDLVDARYILACPNDCFERGYLKRSKRIKQPWEYRCKECDTRLVSYDAGESPGTIEPGTCHVASIPWEQAADQNGAHTSETARYLLGCPNGCTEWPYQQRAKRIKNPWLYTCPECETTLVSCDGVDTPTTFEPGTCNVESIPWVEPQVIHACPNGCFSVGYAQHCEQTRHPARYSCEECGTRMISHPADQRPANPTPGTNYIDSGVE
jgi:predicted SprT family Zn-dependent metalloprotease